MFKYTRASLGITIQFFKKIAKIMSVIGSIFTGIYFILAIWMGIGYKIANLVLASLYLIYVLVSLFTLRKEKKGAKKVFLKSYKWIRFIIKGGVIASTIYGMYVATENSNNISIILSVFTIIWWVIQVVLEVAINILEPKIKLIYAGILKDLEPFVKVYNVKQRLTRNEEADLHLEKYVKELEILGEKVSEMDEIKEQKKLKFRELLKERKAQRKQDRKANKKKKNSQ